MYHFVTQDIDVHVAISFSQLAGHAATLKSSFHGHFFFDEDFFVTETLAMSLRSHTAKITYIT